MVSFNLIVTRWVILGIEIIWPLIVGLTPEVVHEEAIERKRTICKLKKR